MKALVISGGGSKGAFAGGIAEHLIKEKGIEYDLFVGSSTGSLLSPLLASNNLEKAKMAYTTLNMKDIFSISPYKVIKKKGVEFIRMHHINIFRSFWNGNKTFGSTKKLRKTISTIFTEEDFNQIKNNKVNVITTVSNLSLQTVEYKSLSECSYSDFCDWTWASANFIPFMSLVTKDDMEYGDGGFGNNIPVQAAIDAGAKEIDVIILDPIERLSNQMKSTNVFDLTFKLLDFMLEQNKQNRLELSKLRAQKKLVKINRYHTPVQLTENSLVFNTKIMKKWWKEGLEYARNFDPKEAIIIPE